MKCCSTCKQVKPLSDFNNERKSRDGKSWRCRACAAVARRADWHRNKEARMLAHAVWVQANRDKVRASQRRWDERNEEKKRSYLSQWEKSNPTRKRAHTAVRRALKAGTLVRPPACQKCGTTGRVVAHHPDYFKPLDVEWLCVPCHRVAPHKDPEADDSAQAVQFRRSARGHTRLSSEQRKAVAEAVRSGRAQADVAGEFGVSQATVSSIVRAEVSLAGSGVAP